MLTQESKENPSSSDPFYDNIWERIQTQKAQERHNRYLNRVHEELRVERLVAKQIWEFFTRWQVTMNHSS